MSVSGSVITAPVSISDVQTVLGSTSSDLGTLCQHNNINMWAKYKPISYALVGLLNNTVRAAQNYGISNIPVWSGSASKIVDMADFWFGVRASLASKAPICGYQAAYWDYRRPMGGSASPFRLADFSEYPLSSGSFGYFHGAPAPIASSGITNYTADSQGNLRLQSVAGINSDPRCLHLDDFSYLSQYSVSNMYFGIMLHKVGSSPAKYFAGTQTTKMSQLASYNAWLDITGWSSANNGTYEMFPFCANQPFSFTDNFNGISANVFIALLEKETIGIGSTVVRLPVLSFNAYYQTSSSTRLLFYYLSLDNTGYTGTLNFTATLEVFNSSNSVIKTATLMSSVAGSSIYQQTPGSPLSIDMGSLSLLTSAYSVRVTVTITTSGVNKGDTYAVCDVTNGPGRG